MGSLIGHVAPGLGLAFIGMWHLWNILCSGLKNPHHYRSKAWFPVQAGGGRLYYLELLIIAIGSSVHISMELVFSRPSWQPFDKDWSIGVNELKNFEHASMSLFFVIYAVAAMLYDRRYIRLPDGMVQLLAAAAFSQELLLFYFHSTDHAGVESHYHWLLRLPIAACLVAVLLEIQYQKSFLLSVFRAIALIFQGLWMNQMGLVIWIPLFNPKGCNRQHGLDMAAQGHGHGFIACESDLMEHRAYGLADLQFNWYLAAILIATTALYSILAHKFEQQHLLAGPESLPLVNVKHETGNESRSRSGLVYDGSTNKQRYNALSDHENSSNSEGSDDGHIGDMSPSERAMARAEEV